MSTKKGKYGNPKNRRPLVGDLNRLAQPTGNSNPRGLRTEMTTVHGGESGTLLDLTDVVHLESMEVCTVDAVRTGMLQEQMIFAMLRGRINKTKDHVQVGFVFGPDGAAALITELLALADRFGAELLSDVTRRLSELHQNKAVDLHFLKAAIDLVLENE